MKTQKCRLFIHGLFLSIFLFTINSCSNTGQKITFQGDNDSQAIQFAMSEIDAAFEAWGNNPEAGKSQGATINFKISPDETIKAEGFRISREGEKIDIIATDEAGAMYGGLEVAEQIRINGTEGVTAQLQNPYMQMRGTKFNIPLDVRTPSYSDMSDIAQANIPEMWSMDFWKEYIDNLARYRYNFISLWNLHPFPSLVKVPGYEDVALDDVLRSNIDFEENYTLQARDITTPEILSNTDTLIKISMEEKIEFWKKVMAYGKSRNVDFYVVTWNLYFSDRDNKYGITEEIDNPVTTDYLRKSVAQMFLSYPDLAGIGLTTGENMHDAGFEEKENWAYETYGKGVLDAAAELPDRKITLIHRQHQAGAQEIAKKFKPLVDDPNINFIFSFKYAKAHVMSATTQPYHTGFVNDIGDMKTIWTLRNDDNYYYRWGAPDFVRDFVQNIPYDIGLGYYYGSDQWIWGREITMKNPDGKRQIEIAKHWYHWMLWGRLGYNPELTNERFIGILQSRFPEVDGSQLFEAWQAASMVYPTTTGFHWGPLDFHWYIEACKSRPDYARNNTGFHDVNRFISLGTHKESGFQSIPDFVDMELKGESSDLKTPFEVAGMLEDYANKAENIVETMNPQDNLELTYILHDIKTMALLGEYYSHKISGSANLALYRATDDKKYQEKAVSDLEQALEAWELYTDFALEQNVNPIWTNRVGYVDWVKITDWVAQDIEIAKNQL